MRPFGFWACDRKSRLAVALFVLLGSSGSAAAGTLGFENERSVGGQVLLDLFVDFPPVPAQDVLDAGLVQAGVDPVLALFSGGVIVSWDATALRFGRFDFAAGPPPPDDPALRLLCPDATKPACDAFAADRGGGRRGMVIGVASFDGIVTQQRAVLGTLALDVVGGGSAALSVEEDVGGGAIGVTRVLLLDANTGREIDLADGLPVDPNTPPDQTSLADAVVLPGAAPLSLAVHYLPEPGALAVWVAAVALLVGRRRRQAGWQRG